MFCATKDKQGGIEMFGGFFDKLKDGLAKTRNSITEKVSEVLNLAITIDDELYEELEEILITSDIGVETSIHVIEKLKKKVKEDKIKSPAEIRAAARSR